MHLAASNRTERWIQFTKRNTCLCSDSGQYFVIIVSLFDYVLHLVIIFCASTLLSLTSNIGCNMITIKNIYVSSDNFILNNIDSNNHGRSNIICSIPVNGSSGSFLFCSVVC